MKCPTQHMHENDMWFSYQSVPELQTFMIPIPTPIPLGLIPILIPISGFTQIHDSDSNYDSSSKWLWFWFRSQCFPKNWFRFQHHVIPIPIPTNQALIPMLIPESDSASGIWYIVYIMPHSNPKKVAQSVPECSISDLHSQKFKRVILKRRNYNTMILLCK